jgi:hypothetical protein
VLTQLTGPNAPMTRFYRRRSVRIPRPTDTPADSTADQARSSALLDRFSSALRSVRSVITCFLGTVPPPQ